ncbi:MAG: helix-turn-helix transcriptional regulator [Sphingomonadaceae bacterium]
MALTSRDETDLLLPLYRGMQETSRFRTFLERVQRRTGAEYVGIVVRKDDSPLRDATEFFAGMDLRALAHAEGIEDLYTLESLHHDMLRPGRVYSTSDFADHDPTYQAQRKEGIERLGIVDERVVRVSDTAGISAWLVLARGKPCTAADSALLSNLAPYVAAVMDNFVVMESRRMDAAMAMEGLGRAGTGWILFDRDANVLSFDEQSAGRLAAETGIAVRHGARLAGTGRKVASALVEAARSLAGRLEDTSHTALLCEEPRVEALLVSANEVGHAGLKAPAMLAVYRLARTPSPARIERLAQLFDLPPREAELAIALADGLSIAEAAETMGLTIETARNYSKRLYAKLGVSGQAQLVRKVCDSSAVLA